jgi:hypothetical protein
VKKERGHVMDILKLLLLQTCSWGPADRQDEF